MKGISKVLSTLSFICLILCMLLSSVQYWCFNRSFYQKEYAKANTSSAMKMSMKDLMASTDILLDYLEDRTDSMEIYATVDGDEREVFNDREKEHMVDVRNLYHHAMMARDMFGIAGIFLLILLFFKNSRSCVRNLKFGLKYGTQLIAVFLMLTGIWVVADFEGFWYTFHEILFTNDLWLLDPNTSLMINMFPGDFFFHLVLRIMLTTLSGIVIIRIVLEMLERRKRV